MSTSSVVSSASALCGTHEGMCSTSPAPTSTVSDSSSPSQKRSFPSRMYVSCSFSCEWRGTTHPFRGRPGPASFDRSRSTDATGRPSAAPSAGRPSGGALLSAQSQDRPEARDPVVDLLLVDEAVGEAEAVRAPAVRKEQHPGNDGNPLLDRPPCQLDSVDPRQCQPREEAATRRRPPRRLR